MQQRKPRVADATIIKHSNTDDWTFIDNHFERVRSQIDSAESGELLCEVKQDDVKTKTKKT